MTSSKQGRVRSYVSGPRWAGIKEFLWSLANRLDVEFKVTDHDKGWLTETIYYQIEGDKEKLRLFDKEVNKAVRRSNA